MLSFSKSIISLLDQINRELGITIVVVTHQMSVLRSICERAAIMENGVIVEDDRVDSIFLRQPKVLQDLVGADDRIYPHTGRTVKILLPVSVSGQPVITRMSHDLNIDFLVLGGELESYRQGVLGALLVNVEDKDYKDVIDYLNKKQIPWRDVMDKEAEKQ